MYRSPDARILVNLQERAGMAKAYQVRQLLEAIEDDSSTREEKDDDHPR